MNRLLSFALAAACALSPACSRREGSPDHPAPGPASQPGDVVVRLRDGSTLRLPADAKLARQLDPPPNLVSAEIYQLPSIDGVLVVNLGKPTGKACKAMLDEERANGEKARNDEALRASIRVDTAEVRQLGGVQALYTEGASRSVAEAKAGQPYHPGVGYFVCTKDAFINFNLTLVKGEMTPAIRDVAKAIATSAATPAAP